MVSILGSTPSMENEYTHNQATKSGRVLDSTRDAKDIIRAAITIVSSLF